ncbi:MAG: isochorismatase family protein [Candidatus Melainabacteria bacterium]|nr:isochorismatase family protein [Candidatus Melainabacteria bacterium]
MKCITLRSTRTALTTASIHKLGSIRRTRSIDDGTLVVVDLQRFFVNGCLNPHLVANVVREVTMAKRKGWAVVIVECEPWRNGKTITPIARLLSGKSGYTRKRRMSKESEDGSQQVIEACRESGFSLANFRVVGVYSDCCVEQTAVSLVEKLEGAFVRVVKRACSTNFEEETGWEVFRKRARLKVA